MSQDELSRASRDQDDEDDDFRLSVTKARQFSAHWFFVQTLFLASQVEVERTHFFRAWAELEL